jgi:uncharacterized protein (DUF1810 family)
MASFEEFIQAQDFVWPQVLAELRAGAKRTHWMWFVFPQLRELGRSERARFYGISGLDEAKAYLKHPVLGARLVECTGIVNGVVGRSAREIFGSPDDLKFRSCVTLFGRAGGGEVFSAALAKYYGGIEDAATVELLRR